MKLVASTSPPRPLARALVLLAGALTAFTAASCKDEKVRIPFTSVTPPPAIITTATPIFFTVRDKPNQFVTVAVDVSSDGGLTYKPATAAAGQPSQVVIAAAPAGATGYFYWDPVPDLGPGIHREVDLRVSAYGRDFGVPGDTGRFTVDLTDRLDPVASGGDARALPVATPLPDGRVWVAGGQVGASPSSGGFIYDPRTNALTTASGLQTPRATPGWALLRGGQVLVAGGEVGGAPTDAAETFTITTSGGAGQIATVTTGLVVARSAPAVAALPDGRAVVIGGAGAGGAPVADVEVFTPGAGGGTFAVAFTDAATARLGATATTLPDGRVLVVGGVNGAGVPQTTALLIDAGATGATATDDDIGRAQHAAVLLPDGRVLVAGGTTTALDDPTGATTVASIYDPTTGQFESGGLMNLARHRPGLAYAGGYAVAFGGAGGSGVGSRTSEVTAERLVIETGDWVEITAPSGTPRPDAVAVATGPGRALVVGGGAAPEVYTPDASPTTQAFDPVITTVPAPRADHTATVLYDGTVLVVGGTDGVGTLSSVERYSLQTRSFTARAALARPRAEHAAALTGGGVLVVGGRDPSGAPMDEAELYDAVADRWTSAGSLSTPRAGATAVTLADGSVLVSGGVDAGGLPLSSQERWDPFTRTFSTTTALSEARAEHRAVTYNGAAVVGPGQGATGPTDAVDVLRAPTFVVDTATEADRGRAGLSLPLAAPGVVLVSGGDDAAGPRADAALLDLRGLGFTPPAFLAGTRPLVYARSDHEAVALRSGTQVLLSGGRGPDGAIRDEGELFAFQTDITTGEGQRTTDRRAAKARVRHTATLLSTGLVLIVGGVDERGVTIAGAELYQP